MAEISSSAGRPQRAGVRRVKKMSTRVDLTPMVDLGFLLITFFIFTTSMTTPRAMRLYLPADGPGMTAGESVTLTIIPVAGNKVFYYHGQLEQALRTGQYGSTNFAIASGIGDIIRRKQQLLNKSGKFTEKDMILVIKPDATASYKAIAASIDEVLINAVGHYAFTDLEQPEKDALARLHIQ